MTRVRWTPRPGGKQVNVTSVSGGSRGINIHNAETDTTNLHEMTRQSHQAQQ